MNGPGSSLSIALTTCDGSPYIGEQLSSLLRQSRPPSEILVGDDCSKDVTCTLVRQALDGSGIQWRLVQNRSRLGVIANIELALRRSSGEFIALSDQDDRWRDDKVAVVEQHFEDPRVTAVFSDARLIDETGRVLPGRLWSAVGFTPESIEGKSIVRLERLLRGNVVTGATLVIRRSVLECALPLPRHYHDHWLALVAAGMGLVVAEPEALIDYRLHRDNLAGLRGASGIGRLRVAAKMAGKSRSKAVLLELLLSRLAPVCDVETRKLLGDWLQFLEYRGTLPRSRLARLALIGMMVRSGSYARYSRGLPAAWVDLLLPASRFEEEAIIIDGW